MDWDRAIERNREALKRVLASLVAMAGLAVPVFSSCGRRRRGESETDEGYLQGHPTLSRHLHRAVLRLLRPAEAAARRLVIVAARGLVVELPPVRLRKPKPKPKYAFLRKGVGTGIILPRNVPHPDMRSEAQPRRALCLPLTDALPRWRRSRPAAKSVPRISVPGFTAPHPVPVRRPPSPGDLVDATRLSLRLEALGRALDDLPKHAWRFACWRSRRDRGLVRRISPLRPGRPPGLSDANRRRPVHEVHEVLADLQYFAREAIQRPDTS